MQFDPRPHDRGPLNPAAPNDAQRVNSGHPSPEERGDGDLGDDAVPTASQPAVPSEVMSLMRQIVRYHARIHEGLLRENADLLEAILQARQSSDGMTEEEHTRAHAIIRSNSAWYELFIRLMQASTDEVYEELLKHRRPN